MHVQGLAGSNLQKLTRACGQLLKATPDHSAPLVVAMAAMVVMAAMAVMAAIVSMVWLGGGLGSRLA